MNPARGQVLQKKSCNSFEMMVRLIFRAFRSFLIGTFLVKTFLVMPSSRCLLKTLGYALIWSADTLEVVLLGEGGRRQSLAQVSGIKVDIV